jgi:hypothetical protein
MCLVDDLDDVDQIFLPQSETSIEATLDGMLQVDSRQRSVRSKEISMHPTRVSIFKPTYICK